MMGTTEECVFPLDVATGSDVHWKYLTSKTQPAESFGSFS